jgi:hypothetical protein
MITNKVTDSYQNMQSSVPPFDLLLSIIPLTMIKVAHVRFLTFSLVQFTECVNGDSNILEILDVCLDTGVLCIINGTPHMTDCIKYSSDAFIIGTI